MRTALTYWGRSQASAPTSTLVIHRPDQINWVRVALQFALGRGARDQHSFGERVGGHQLAGKHGDSL